MRLAVVGPGALGTLFAALLAPHADVTLVGRREEAVASLRERGIHLTTPSGERTVPIAATTEPATVGAVDFVLVLVKAYQTRGAAATVAPLLGPDTLVVSIQNGLGNAETLAEVVGADRVVAGTTQNGGLLLGPGSVRHAGAGPTYLGVRPETRDRLDRLAELFRAADLEVVLTDRIESVLWGKLLLNAGINGPCAILRITNGTLPTIPTGWLLAGQAVAEAAAVARARGVELPYADPVAELELLARRTGVNQCSMLRDVLERRPTEAESIYGAIVAAAALVDIPAPTNAFLRDTLRAIEESAESRVD